MPRVRPWRGREEGQRCRVHPEGRRLVQGPLRPEEGREQAREERGQQARGEQAGARVDRCFRVILDGKALSVRLNKALKAKVEALDPRPGLAVVLVGEDPASQVYVRRKGQVAGRVGFHHWQIDFPADVGQDELLAAVDRLNADPSVDGILVQLPLPKHLDTDAVIERIDPAKDVDGLTLGNIGRLAQGRPRLVACTPKGVMALLEESGVKLEGRDACVIGRSAIVGRPLAMLLEQANCTVTLCHSRTRDLRSVVERSDIVVAAVGVPEMVKGAWIREGAVVIDVGVNRLGDGSLVGDVEYGPAAERAAAITPVPGGVGPMTIAMLMENTYRAYLARR
ncbi:MAG: bifunctional methylenetetrahydrofolate dehydrogenase/methenyltetrahydrofolate cyclohydrolase FolD [Myxococcales bacterium]|nr:bifunctional methylenetetrahydrofolate dehydrogenase/methenyltetrahydrofolate cyclohydrolase FolD [Myxococcales bacterium]